MKKITKKIGLGMLVLFVAIAVGAGVIYNMHNAEVTQEREEARQQEQKEARDELQQLKGEVRIIQFLSVRSDFSAIGLQEALKEQLQSSIERVENSDNQYLQDVSIPIAEDSVLVACDEATEYINHWIDEIG